MRSLRLKGSVKITLNIKKAQLNVLLSAIESVFTTDMKLPYPARGPELLAKARAMHPSPRSYDIEAIAPSYEQLVAHWDDLNTEPAMAWNETDQFKWGERFKRKNTVRKALAA